MSQPYPLVIYCLGLRFQFSFESMDEPDLAHYTCTIGHSTKVRAFTRKHALELAPTPSETLPTIEELEAMLCKPIST